MPKSLKLKILRSSLATLSLPLCFATSSAVELVPVVAQPESDTTISVGTNSFRPSFSHEQQGEGQRITVPYATAIAGVRLRLRPGQRVTPQGVVETPDEVTVALWDLDFSAAVPGPDGLSGVTGTVVTSGTLPESAIRGQAFAWYEILFTDSYVAAAGETIYLTITQDQSSTTGDDDNEFRVRSSHHGDNGRFYFGSAPTTNFTTVYVEE